MVYLTGSFANTFACEGHKDREDHIWGISYISAILCNLDCTLPLSQDLRPIPVPLPPPKIRGIEQKTLKFFLGLKFYEIGMI